MKVISCFYIVVALSLALLLAFVGFSDVYPRLIWNVTESAPKGLYVIRNARSRIGSYVLITPRGEMKKIVYERGYLPPDIPLIKRVAALPGDKICRDGEAIFINKVHVADAQKTDSLGREMPRWSGCFTLKIGEIFLLNDHEKSLDGRYFGATKLNDVIGVAVSVWVRE